MKKLLSLFAALLCGSVLSVHAEDTYKIDSVHSSISFKVRHFFSYVTGNFTKFEGTIHVDPDHPEKSSVTATIDAASVDTKNEKRDGDLRSGRTRSRATTRSARRNKRAKWMQVTHQPTNY